MTLEFGFLMFLYGMTCIFIGALAVYYVINKVQKTPEQIEQEENEKYLKHVHEDVEKLGGKIDKVYWVLLAAAGTAALFAIERIIN
jgi:heme/copper-type cytochrome/quinol oxidase subunit 3